jgi:flavin reductase (DIM6/NTAB) family NADH-FMN oxidoreductase RutF
MQLLKKVLEKLNGYAYRQEYLCLADEPFPNPLSAYIMQGNTILQNVTNAHLFIGYHPLIFAFPWLEQPDLSTRQELEVRFTPQILLQGATLTAPDARAVLKLRKINQQGTGNRAIFYYEGISGHHRFISRFHQWINRINNRLYQQKPGNVYLDNRLYPQVQTAYALPRRVSLVSLQLNGGFNLFPTDLQGQINPDQYIISLRHAGMACRQVQEAGKIVISAIQPSLYRETYKLGKNHMQPVKPKEAFNFSGEKSTLFGLPLPPQTVEYCELELQSFFDYGIHRVLLFDIKNQQIALGGRPLTHIHNSYATWRLKHGLTGNYLLR